MRLTKCWNSLSKGFLFLAAGSVAVVLLIVALTVVSGRSEANRQFQRDTGKPCGYCHVPGNEPELNSRGREYQSCGYKWCNSFRREPPKRRNSSCDPGYIPCAAYCDKYDRNPHGCKFSGPRSCMAKYGNVHECVPDR